MRRLALVVLLLSGGVLNAHADNDVYDNVRKQARGDGVLQLDTSYCSLMLGAPNHMYPDPDNPGLMCRDFTIGGITGSSRSNF